MEPHAPNPPARPAQPIDISGGQRPANGEMSVREAGRLGGHARKQALGPDGYSELGHRGVDALREQLGSGAMATIGREGGHVRRRMLGREGYARLGRQGGRRMRELVGKGRQAEHDTRLDSASVGDPMADGSASSAAPDAAGKR